jgi:isocitrate dehydrogenase (NAD+)
MYRVTLIPGDGIGPEVTDVAVKCIEATGVKIEWESSAAGQAAVDRYGTVLPDETLTSIKKNRVALKGPLTTPLGKGFRSVNVSLRKELDLYACVRPCKNYIGIKSPFGGIDMVVIRENTEDVYVGVEFMAGESKTRELLQFAEQATGTKIQSDSSVSLKPISYKGSERIAEFAFAYAMANARTKVTAATKANIMKYTDGLFMKVTGEVAQRYPKIPYEHLSLDNLCAQLVQKPQQFDVLVLPNLYGDIISSLCAGLVGGLGIAPSANFGKKYAIFEAAGGSAPDIAGKGTANPTALLLASVLMLKHLGEAKAASKLENAVKTILKDGRLVTSDLSSRGVSTWQMGEAVMQHIRDEI